jgi:hypothetical protein
MYHANPVHKHAVQLHKLCSECRVCKFFVANFRGMGIVYAIMTVHFVKF